MGDSVCLGDEVYIEGKYKLSDILLKLRCSKDKKLLGGGEENEGMVGVDEFEGMLGGCSSEMTSDLVINVFVVCGFFGDRLNLGLMYEQYGKKMGGSEENRLRKDGGYVMEYNPLSRKGVEMKEKKTFFNCVMLSFNMDGVNISCKIFENGKFQLNGCKRYGDCFRMSDIVFRILCSYKGISENRLELRDIKLGMINSGFTFVDKEGNARELNREKITDLLNRNGWKDGGNWRFAIYQTGKKYHGIKATYWTEEACNFWKNINVYIENKGYKIPETVYGQVSVLIFRTGKVILTGAKSISHIRDAYRCFVDLARKNEKEFFS